MDQVSFCYNTTKSNMYFGVYRATDTTITNNLIIKNPKFPGTISRTACGSTYDNKLPFTSYGVLYTVSNVIYNMFDSGTRYWWSNRCLQL